MTIDATEAVSTQAFSLFVATSVPFDSLSCRLSNYRDSLWNTFDADLQRVLTASNERVSWEAHHRYEVGRRQNGQFLARRSYRELGINVHAPGYVVFVPRMIHKEISRAREKGTQLYSISDASPGVRFF